MRKFIFMAIFLAMALPAHAADIYFAQSAAGGNTGANCANARAASTNASGDDVAGNTLHLCGTFTGSAGATGLFVFQGGGASGNPLTLVFESGAGFTAPYWGGSGGNGGVIQDQGYNYVVINGGSNGYITATANGTGLANKVDSGTCVQMLSVSYSEVKNLTCSNIYVHQSGSDGNGFDTSGVFWNGGSNNTIDNNTFHDVMKGIYYVYPGNATTSNLAFFSNKIYNINWGITLGDGNTNATLSGTNLIYSNTIHDWANWDDTSDIFHHDGIFPFAGQTGSVLTGLQVYDNYLYGNPGSHGTAEIYLSGDSGQVQSAYVFNNVLTISANYFNDGLMYFLSAPHTLVYNNTLVGLSSTDNQTGFDIQTGSNGIASPTTFENNIFLTMQQVLYFASGSIAIDASNYNEWYGNGALVQIHAGAYYSSLGAWNSASGYDGSSVSGNPNLTAYVPIAGSPVIAHATSFYSTCNGKPNPGIGALCKDAAGISRPSSAWDVGAYQSGSSAAAPTPPLITAINAQ